MGLAASFSTGGALRPALQAIEHRGELLVSHPGHQIEIDSGILERAPKAKHERQLLRSQLEAILDQGYGEVGGSFGAKCRVRHRQLGELLQDIDTNRAILGSIHVSGALCLEVLWSARQRLYIPRENDSAMHAIGNGSRTDRDDGPERSRTGRNGASRQRAIFAGSNT